MSYYRNKSSTPCKFFQQGTCNKGNNCKFAHVYTNSGVSNNRNSSNSSSYQYNSGDEKLKAFIDPSSIGSLKKILHDDLTESVNFQTKPLLSSYSCEPPCAVNLIHDRDYSFEESRFEFYQANKNGAMPNYETMINARTTDMAKCISQVNSKLNDAASYLQSTTKAITQNIALPNSGVPFINWPLDLTGQSYANSSNNQNSFNSRTFGNPSAFGSSPFGGPAAASNVPFGSTSSGTNSAFGAPKFGSLGASNNALTGAQSGAFGGAFGAPSFGSQTAGSSAFGKPAFGNASGTQPNAMGSSAFGQAGFGNTQSNSISNTSPFSGLNNNNTTSLASSAFGAPAFGSPAFGTSSFTNASNNDAKSNSTPFGALSASATQSSTSAFAATSFGNSAFGQSSLNKSAFGTPAFGGTKGNIAGTNAAPNSPFGSLNSDTTNVNASSPFGKINSTAGNAGISAFGSATLPFGSNAAQPSSSPFSNSLSNQTVLTNSAFGGSAFNSNNKDKNDFNVTAGGPNSGSTSGFGSSGIAFGIPTAQSNNGASNTQNFGNQNSNASFGVQQSNEMIEDILGQGPLSDEDSRNTENLSDETKKKFQAPEFSLGFVPDIPPPTAFCA